MGYKKGGAMAQGPRGPADKAVSFEGVSRPRKAEGERSHPSKDPEIKREQFTALAIPLADLLYASACRMLSHRHQAEDLVQDAFAQAWRGFDKFELGTNFKAWIFRILSHLHMNARRKANWRDVTMGDMEKTIAGAPERKPIESEIPSTDWDALYPELVGDELKEALTRLKKTQRVVLMLVALGGLSYKECSDALGIPIGTVMSRLFRARERLKTDLHIYAMKRGFLRAGDQRL